MTPEDVWRRAAELGITIGHEGVHWPPGATQPAPISNDPVWHWTRAGMYASLANSNTESGALRDALQWGKKQLIEGNAGVAALGITVEEIDRLLLALLPELENSGTSHPYKPYDPRDHEDDKDEDEDDE